MKRLPIILSFEHWEKAGSPVDPAINLKRVWTTSPHGQEKKDKAPSAIRGVRVAKGVRRK